MDIIPANGHKEPKHVNPYLKLLVDELLDLTGVELYDAYQKATFAFKVKLLNYVLDYCIGVYQYSIGYRFQTTVYIRNP